MLRLSWFSACDAPTELIPSDEELALELFEVEFDELFDELLLELLDEVLLPPVWLAEFEAEFEALAAFVFEFVLLLEEFALSWSLWFSACEAPTLCVRSNVTSDWSQPHPLSVI